MRIFVFDRQRHRLHTGYGMTARRIILELRGLGHEMLLAHTPEPTPWGDIERGSREALEQLPVRHPAELDDIDVVLQIGQPSICRHFTRPSVMWTQNALGDLPEEWVRRLRFADAIVVPNRLDGTVFGRYFDNVRVVPEGGWPEIFRPRPQARADGPDAFTFLYVGQYGYRKGVDLLVRAFCEEFDASEPVQLRLLCAPARDDGDVFNHLIATMQRHNPMARIQVSTKPVPPERMRKLYNRVDCVISLTRGEGWCMPFPEALLCEKPVIAPYSTAMRDYLDDDIAYLVPVHEQPIDSIEDPFARGFRKHYGSPGNVCWEPDLDAARARMRTVYEHYDAALTKARAGRERIRSTLRWRDLAREIESMLAAVAGAENA